ncbi:hypothetical protein BDF19DRAFT_433092 [Syncephalis fuscata]|nr:hypothetical protein BDF19DRAFT_433092 [Syncephalis fuscata]
MELNATNETSADEPDIQQITTNNLSSQCEIFCNQWITKPLNKLWKCVVTIDAWFDGAPSVEERRLQEREQRQAKELIWRRQNQYIINARSIDSLATIMVTSEKEEVIAKATNRQPAIMIPQVQQQHSCTIDQLTTNHLCNDSSVQPLNEQEQREYIQTCVDLSGFPPSLYL